MSKKMTPCEKLGYEVGDKFEIIVSKHGWIAGDVVKLVRDDGSVAPEFEGVTTKNSIYDDNKMFLYIDGERSCVKLIPAQLKPAKQSLADAIHQNGGWSVAGDCNFVTSNRSGVVKFFNQNPLHNGADWVSCPYSLSWIDLHQQLPNWHRCILSRDEYFAAYPEQVKVEICNETKHKVEVEMESESEVTIKVGDWHKNGELPPVGVVCLYVVSDRCSAEVEITAHARFGLCFVEVGKSGECYVSKTAELHRFIPIRTEREKAIDEMVCEFIDHYGDPKGGEHYIRIATKLYDAGYSKEVK